jgi:hypothetical protein
MHEGINSKRKNRETNSVLDSRETSLQPKKIKTGTDFFPRRPELSNVYVAKLGEKKLKKWLEDSPNNINLLYPGFACFLKPAPKKVTAEKLTVSAETDNKVVGISRQHGQ